MTRLDLVFVADVRFEGGTSTAIAVELAASVRAGLTVGLIMVKGPLLAVPFPVHPQIRRFLDEGTVERLDPELSVSARLAVIHHPTIMENRPTRPIGLRADRVVLVLHHPVRDRAGVSQYDLPRVLRNASDAFAAEIEISPVSDVVRRSLPAVPPPGSRITDFDWENLLDLDDWPERAPRPIASPIVIGRHSRPDGLKWPNLRSTALAAYPPDAGRYRIRILGGGDYLAERYGLLPANWELLPFAFDGTAEFLQTLDFYVYHHSDEWSEAFGRVILEALAVGLVVFLPPHFEPLFGPAAIYAEPTEVEAAMEPFTRNDALYAEQAARARAFVAERFDARLFEQRLAPFGLGPGRDAPPETPLPPLPARNVLFVSSNGIGLGHLTQQLAVARRLPPRLRSSFATMSYSMQAVVEEGYPAHFLTYHRHIDADVDDWNRVLAEELFDLLVHLRPAVFAYDATAVFEGVIQAIESHPDIFSIWVRRAMWRESHRAFLDVAGAFDAVIEPGELAEEFDTGPTAAWRHGVLRVAPVLHLDPGERLPRQAAREALGLREGEVAVALQLGSGANFDMSGARAAIVAALLDRPDTLVLDLRSPLTIDAPDGVAPRPRLRRLSLFPSFRYSLAFDAAVSAAGYNAFHEQVLGAIPTLFVPNEAPDMDRQLARARWAELTGRGLLLRRDFDLPRVGALVERLLDPAQRAAFAKRNAAIAWSNGTREIARYVEDHARLVRTDRDITKEV